MGGSLKSEGVFDGTLDAKELGCRDAVVIVGAPVVVVVVVVVAEGVGETLGAEGFLVGVLPLDDFLAFPVFPGMPRLPNDSATDAMLLFSRPPSRYLASLEEEEVSKNLRKPLLLLR